MFVFKTWSNMTHLICSLNHTWIKTCVSETWHEIYHEAHCKVCDINFKNQAHIIEKHLKYVFIYMTDLKNKYDMILELQWLKKHNS